MTQDVLPLRRIDHVRFFVGNARQSAYFYRNAFGFDVIAYAGLETGLRDEAGYVLRQGQITFVLASPLSPDHPDNRRLVQHGDGVQDIALEVDSVEAAFAEAVRRGAEGVTPPTLREDEHGVYELATIRTYGDTTHSFVNRDRYRGVFAPGYLPLDPGRYGPLYGLAAVILLVAVGILVALHRIDALGLESPGQEIGDLAHKEIAERAAKDANLDAATSQRRRAGQPFPVSGPDRRRGLPSDLNSSRTSRIPRR